MGKIRWRGNGDCFALHPSICSGLSAHKNIELVEPVVWSGC
ncbi:MAG: hypothetical protein ACK452_02895 [Bacteroidota bacterium]